MNLSQMLAQPQQTKSVSKAQAMVTEHLMSEEEGGLTASFGIGSDSFHWGLMEITPPKNTVQVENPGDTLDKKRRKNKALRKYETQLQMNQRSGPVMVHTVTVDNNDVMDITRSCWFV